MWQPPPQGEVGTETKPLRDYSCRCARLPNHWRCLERRSSQYGKLVRDIALELASCSPSLHDCSSARDLGPQRTRFRTTLFPAPGEEHTGAHERNSSPP